MSEIFFRNIIESDMKEVSILLNQLKEMDLSSITTMMHGTDLFLILVQIQ